MNIISKVKIKIESYYPTFTKSEKKVAQYILDNYSQIMYLSVSELAEYAEVGETTVFRFCKKMGYKGYPEFKLIIAQDIVDSKENENEPKSQNNFAEIIQDNIITKIKECYTSLKLDKLNEAIDYIYKANRIFFYGVGNSGLAATTAKERFIRIGITADTALDAHRQSIVSSILSTEDIIIAFSLSGNTIDIDEALKIANKNGVKIIVVTSYIKSPITKYADVILQTAGKDNLIEGGTLVTSISQLYIVDLLVTGVSLKNKQRTISMRERTGRSIINKIYS